MPTKRTPIADEFPFQRNVKDKDLLSPPGSSNKGDRYLINGIGTGNWSGQDYNIAEYNGSSWFFISKTEGMIVWIEDENKYYVYDGSNWTIYIGATGPTGPTGANGSDGATGPTGPTGGADLKRVIILKVLEDTESLITGDGQINVVIPSTLNGMNLIEAHAHVYTASSSGKPTIAVYNATDSHDMLSTNITIDANETDSKDAATKPVINTSYDDVATGDVIRIDVDVAGTGTKGLEVRLTFQKP